MRCDCVELASRTRCGNSKSVFERLKEKEKCALVCIYACLLTICEFACFLRSSPGSHLMGQWTVLCMVWATCLAHTPTHTHLRPDMENKVFEMCSTCPIFNFPQRACVVAGCSRYSRHGQSLRCLTPQRQSFSVSDYSSSNVTGNHAVIVMITHECGSTSLFAGRPWASTPLLSVA